MTRARDNADLPIAITESAGNVSASGNLTVDTNTLVVDATNNRVGVGTASPAATAHIQTSSGNPELRIESTGANYATMSIKNSSRHYSTQIRTDQSNAYVVRDETGGGNRLLIDTSGRVMMPNQPMFTVNGVAAVSTTPGNSQVLNFSGIYLNVGGHFNISQDRFVAPVTGYYFFAFSCMTTTQSHTSNIVIRKNGGGRHSSYTQNATYLRHNIAVVEQLAANDYVDIVLEHGGIHAGFDHFSGFLIG